MEIEQREGAWARPEELEALIVTTAHRGVFFGYGIYQLPTSKEIHLENARMVVYWPKETHGLLGLAAVGPKPGARISPKAPSILLNDVTSVIKCSKEAIKAWEKELWQG